jgi:glucan biosynthesis protein C
MNSFAAEAVSSGSRHTEKPRLDYLDAARAFALVLGIVFHASPSFSPHFMAWAVQDISTSSVIPHFIMVSHSFRMETFFLLAGFFSYGFIQRKGTGKFVRTRMLRIGVPFVVGWFILRPLVVSGWIMGSASLRGDYDFWAGIGSGFKSLQSLPAGLFTGSHLWFLYYLAMITALTLVARGLMAKTGSWSDAVMRRTDAFVAWLVNSPFSLLLLIAPTAAALWFMRFWGMDTPEQSLRPHFPVVTVYGLFFGVGWMLGRIPDAISAFARLWPSRWILAALSVIATVRLSGIQGDPGHPHYTAAHLGFVVCYAVMMWSLVALTLGVFKQLCQRPRSWVRYVADSSYWLYLIHLPIVVWLQVAVAEIPLHWSLKLAFISTATIALALISYDLFVRSTFIGWVLNGRRRDRAVATLFGRISPRPPGQDPTAPAKFGTVESVRP